MLRSEIEKMIDQCVKLETLVIDKEIIRKLKGQVKDVEKVRNENKVLHNVLDCSSRKSKATGDDFAYSTVSYLYTKYIKNSVQESCVVQLLK